MKLLITGGLGYIGSFTAKNYLKKTKKKSIVIDNLSRGNNFAKKYSNNKILNISNSKIKKIIESKKIDSIIHLASLTCVRESIKNKKIYSNNYSSQIVGITIRISRLTFLKNSITTFIICMPNIY